MLPSGRITRYIHFDYDSVETGGLIMEYLRELRIAPRVSAPHCHHQNGYIERAVQTILDRARTLIIAGRAPLKYWDYAVMHAARLVNSTPRADNNKTPHEILTNEKPNIAKLIPWFSPGVYHVTKKERNSTWDPKAKLCRFLGYDHLSRDCYRILSLPDGTILNRKDCVFDTSQLQHNVSDLMEQLEDHDSLIEFESADTEIEHGRLVGDSVAPYFGLTPDEYLEQKRLDEQYSYFARDIYRNDLVTLTVHPPILLPPDPKDIDAALAQDDRELY